MNNELTLFPELPIQEQTWHVGLSNGLHASLKQRAKNIKNIVTKAALEIGKELYEAREELHTETQTGFDKWIEEETGLSRGYAYSLIDTYRQFENCLVTRQFSGESMRVLSGPSIPQSARDEAINRAESGEKITVATAKEIGEAHKAREEAEEAKEEAEQKVKELEELLKTKAELAQLEIDRLSQEVEELQEKQSEIDRLNEQVAELQQELEDTPKPDEVSVTEYKDTEETLKHIEDLKEQNKSSLKRKSKKKRI
jgi:hypothetical protein